MSRAAIILGLMLSLALGTATASPMAKAPEPKPELPRTGVNLARPSGGWLNVEVVGHRFVVKFFASTKKPVAPDKTVGLVRFRYPNRNQVHPGHPLSLSEDGKALISPPKVLPPHNFQVLLFLEANGPGSTTENYSFRYSE